MRFGIPITLKSRNGDQKTPIIDIDYNGHLLSLIKLGLSTTNPDLFNKMYKERSAKQFATSVYFPNAQFIKESIVLNQEGQIKLFFSIHDKTLGLNFYNAFAYLHIQSNKALKSQASRPVYDANFNAYFGKPYLIEVPEIKRNEVLFKTQSPIVVKNKARWNITFDDKDFNESLIYEIKDKLNNDTLKKDADDLKFVPVKMHTVMRKMYHQDKVITSAGVFKLQGKPELLNYLQDAGLGIKTGSFCGMISAI